MLVVATVVRIRRAHAGSKAIREVASDLRLSRKFARKAINAPEGAFAVTGSCLISLGRSRCSVAARAARRAVQVRAYANQIVMRLGDEVIAEHARHFGRDRTICDPWHNRSILAHSQTRYGKVRDFDARHEMIEAMRLLGLKGTRAYAGKL